MRPGCLLLLLPDIVARRVEVDLVEGGRFVNIGKVAVFHKILCHFRYGTSFHADGIGYFLIRPAGQPVESHITW
jgi:hypothetical protein